MPCQNAMQKCILARHQSIWSSIKWDEKRNAPLLDPYTLALCAIAAKMHFCSHWPAANVRRTIEFLLCKNSILIFFTLCFYEVKTLKTKRIWCIKYFNLLHFASCVFVCFHNGYAKMYFCVTKEQNVQQHNYAVRSWCLCVILQSKMYEKEIWCKNAFLQSNAQPP